MKTQNLRRFRQLCRILFGKQATRLLPLLDALASSHNAQTVSVISLHPLHPHPYRTLYQTLSAFGVDTTPYPRPYAQRWQAVCAYPPTALQRGMRGAFALHQHTLLACAAARYPQSGSSPLVWSTPGAPSFGAVPPWDEEVEEPLPDDGKWRVRDVALGEVYAWWCHRVKRQEGGVRSPSQLQRVFGEEVKGLGEVEYVAQPRGKSLDRVRLPPRARCEVVRRGCRSP